MRMTIVRALVAGLALAWAALPALAQDHLAKPTNRFYLEVDLTADIAAGTTASEGSPMTVTVADNSDFAASGIILVCNRGVACEKMRYASKPTGTTFSVVERGMSDEGAIAHDADDIDVTVASGVDPDTIIQLIDEVTATKTIDNGDHPYTMLSADRTLLVDASGGVVTATLPPAGEVTGKRYLVKAEDASSTITLDGDGSETIDGNATVTLSAADDWLEVESDGSNWSIVGQSAGGAGAPDDAQYLVAAADGDLSAEVVIDDSDALAAILSDEEGSGGGFVRATSPALTAPDLGTPSALALDNATGLPEGQVTQHEGALSITESQVSDLDHAVEEVDAVAQDRLLGRVSAGEGVSEELTAAQVRTLLNVEDGAAADQSAAEVLAALLTVDGAGTGLDADQLDGEEATAFQDQGDVLDDLNALGANSADSEFLVGTGPGAVAWESGATVRTSLGLGAAAELGATGADANAVSGTAGTDGNCAEWNADGDLVDAGATCAGGGTPAGSDTEVQYNNGGSFGATALNYIDDAADYFTFNLSGGTPSPTIPTDSWAMWAVADNLYLEGNDGGKFALREAAGIATLDMYSSGGDSTYIQSFGAKHRLGNSDDGDMVLLGGLSGSIVGLAVGSPSGNTYYATLLKEDATSTNPNVLPDGNDPDTGMGATADDDGSLIAGGVELFSFTEAAVERTTQHFIAGYGVDADTIADSGDGNPATHTLDPTTSLVQITCSDSDGCTVTMGETNAANGDVVVITNVSANAANFADTSGVSELAGAFAMGQYDSLTLQYMSDRWVELHRSDN